MEEQTEILRLLKPGDEAMLEAFLCEHAASSMFLRSNLREGGIEYHGRAYQAQYAGIIRGRDIVAVAAHCWNGSMVLQAPVATERVASAAAAASGRKVRWLLGPAAQVEVVRQSPLLRVRVSTKSSVEELMKLCLDRLAVPPALSSGTVRCRRGVVDDCELLTGWRVAHEQEVFHRVPTETLVREARLLVERHCARDELFVLEVTGKLVAMCTFNARLPDTVQIGGVQTLPPERGRGYARSVVAGALLTARAEGAADAILFTGNDNEPALRAYRSLGFERVGDYALLLYDA